MVSEIATVAQSVEQLIRNQQVAGSSPASSSKKEIRSFLISFFCFPNNFSKAVLLSLFALP